MTNRHSNDDETRALKPVTDGRPTTPDQRGRPTMIEQQDYGVLNGHGTVIVLMTAADETRQSVGLYGWVVLEHLASRADPLAPDTAVETSIRAIAAHLAISKDTVTRALRRLIDAGLVDRQVDRKTTTGKFANASYRVHLERAGLRVIATADDPITGPSPEPEPRTHGKPRRRTAAPNAVKHHPAGLRSTDGQLSLLDVLDEANP